MNDGTHTHPEKYRYKTVDIAAASTDTATSAGTSISHVKDNSKVSNNFTAGRDTGAAAGVAANDTVPNSTEGIVATDSTTSTDISKSCVTPAAAASIDPASLAPALPKPQSTTRKDSAKLEAYLFQKTKYRKKFNLKKPR